MSKTRLRSFKDDIENYLNEYTNKLTQAKIDFQSLINSIIPKNVKLGSLEINYHLNRVLYKSGSSTYKIWKRFNFIEDTYYIYLRRLDSDEFVLNNIYLNNNTKLFIKNDAEIDDPNIFFEIRGLHDYSDLGDLLLNKSITDTDINEKVFSFNENNVTYKYYLLKISSDYLNILDTEDVKFFNSNNESIYNYMKTKNYSFFENFLNV